MSDSAPEPSAGPPEADSPPPEPPPLEEISAETPTETAAFKEAERRADELDAPDADVSAGGILAAITQAAVDNPVTVHLVSAILVAAGLVSYFTMPREIFPEFTRERIRVMTVFPGAAPEDMEELITVKVEDALDGIDGVESVESTSQEGVSTVIVRLNPGESLDRVLQDVDRAVQTINDLPSDAEDPVVGEVKTRFPVITLSIYGDVDELALKDLARPIRKKMESVPGVAYARPTGERALEWRIEVDSAALERFGLTIADVSRALSAANLNVPGGSIEGRSSDLLLRTKGETKTRVEIEEVVVRADPDGAHVRVGDVAHAIPGFERALTMGRFNGKGSLNLTALKEKSGDILQIAEAVRELSQELELPPGVEAAVHTDMSVFLRSRLATMQQNALQGFFLVMLSLCVLLNWRMALMVALGIPLAFLATFGTMALFGVSINMMSLFAMILILGMLVDDAIIVTENIYRRIELGEPAHIAAVKGTTEVARPVIATILTTLSAFLPMLLTPGEMGQWMGVVPVVVALCLVASAFECFAILPCHVAEFAKPVSEDHGSWFHRFLGVYEVGIRKAFALRYPLLAGTLGVSVVLVAWASTTLSFELFGKFESDTYFINFELPSTSALDETSERAREVERVALSLGQDERASVSTNIGLAALDINRMDTGSYLGQVIVTFAPEERRSRSITEILSTLRSGTNELSGFTKLEYQGIQAGPGGPAIEVAVEGDDTERLQAAAEALKGWLRQQHGVEDVFDDAVPGKRHLEVVVDQEAAAALGLTTADVAREVRDRFQGSEATTIRRVDEDVPLMVRLPSAARGLRQSLEEAWLRTPNGGRVPFGSVARVVERQGLTKIVRSERRRAITVLAGVDNRVANALQVTERLERHFERRLPRDYGVDLKIKGQRREAEASMVGLLKAFCLALALIYLILGTQFKSFLQPLFVMAAIPFGIDGILVGHILMDKDLTFLSMMGLVATSGIVVNDSLVLVDLVNRLRAAGVSTFEAAVVGSTRRLRPILLTSITTVFGLMPLAFFASGQARFLSPMAISIVFGISFSTGLTLVVIPSLYLVLEDLKELFRGPPSESQATADPSMIPPAGGEGPAAKETT
jgi:hydrophobic/amphiphilic exporter-1 (mainly G- bacteria), HAE1 family